MKGPFQYWLGRPFLLVRSRGARVVADNFSFTEGSGKTFRSRDFSNLQYQVIIPAYINAGDTAAVPLTAATPLPVTAGTFSTSHLITAATTNPTVVKASAGTLRQVSVYNNATYPIKVAFHNSASSPTAGTGVVYAVVVQAGTQRDVPVHRAFSTGIAMTVVKIAASTDMADSSNTAVALNDAAIEVHYE